MRLEPLVLALGLCLSSLSIAQSNSSGSDGCRVVKTVITNGLGQVIETKDTKVCDKPKAAKPAAGEMTPEERKAALARLQELNRQAEEDRKNMRAIEEKYFTPEELERQPSLAGACVSSYLRNGRTQSQAERWCTCVSRNLAPVLTPAERTRYVKDADAFITEALEDPPPGQSRPWRLYSPIAACQR